MRLTARSTVSRNASVFAGALVASIIVAGCGRSAPETAADDALPEAGEPEVAGVQVVSDEAVVVPPPTTAPAPTTTTTAPPAASTTYVVQSGDTLSVIAERFGITIDALSQANGITDVNSIQPGQELIIPGAG